jgi:hypothetical protein
MLSGAAFSDCGRYRYRLEREVGASGPTIAFVLHNPSTAGAENDDATSRRGIGFARSWRASRLIFVNPWAGIATNPKHLWTMADPIGAENDAHIVQAVREVRESGGFVVLAWGVVRPPRARKEATTLRLIQVQALVRAHGCDAFCLGTNKDGSPKHPLYVRADTKPHPCLL